MFLPATRRLVLATLLGAAGLTLAPVTQATTYTWVGTDSNGWSDGTNWQGGQAPPVSGLTTADIVYNSSAYAFPNLSPSYSIRSLTFNAANNGYDFNSGALTLGAGGLTQSSTYAQTFDIGVTLGANQVWTLASGAGALNFNQGLNTNGDALTVNAATTTGGGNTLGGALTGSGSLTKTGAGVLTLTGTNSTYSGGTTIYAGAVSIASANALGTGTVNLSNGELRASANLALGNAYNIPQGDTGTFSAAAGTMLTLTGSFNLAGALSFGSAGQTGTVVFSSEEGGFNNTPLIINAGTLRDGSGGFGLLASDSVSTTVAAGATLDFAGQSNQFAVANLLGAGTVATGGDATTVVSVAAGNFTGTVSGPGALSKTGAGSLTLGGASTYTGGTTLAGGSLGVGNDTALSTGAVAVTGNATLFAAGAVHTLANNVSLASGTTLTVGADPAGAHNLTLNGAISGAGGLTVNATGATATLGGGSVANTFTGLTSVTAGTLALNKNASVQGLGGNLSIGNAGAAPAAGTPAAAVVSVLSSGQIPTTSNVTIYADGSLNLSGSSAANIGKLTMTGGQIQIGAGFVYLYGDVTVNGSATGAQIGSTYHFLDFDLLGAARTFTVARGTSTYDLDVPAGLVDGTLVKNGPGILRLGGDNTYGYYANFAATLNAGTLAVANNAALGDNGGTFTLAGGTVVADGADRAVNNPVNVTGNATVGSSVDGTPRALTFSGATSLAANTILTVSNNAGTAFSGVVSGAGGLLKTGNGTLTLSNTANTFTGGLTLNGGTLAIAGDGSLGGTANVVTLNAGALQYAASATTARTFILNSAATLGSAAGTTLTFGSGASVNGGFLGAGGTVAFANGSALNGTTTALGSTVTTAGAVSFTNATLRGAVAVGAGSTLTASDTLVTSAGSLTVNGTVNTAGLENDGVTTINNGGTIANTGAPLVLGGGSRTTINSGGTLSTANGTSIELNGALLVNNGTQNGNLDVNYGSSARGTGYFGNVAVGTGGQFGNNASSNGGGGNAVVKTSLSYWGALNRANALAQPFVGPQAATTPQVTNVQNLTLGSGSTFNFNLQNVQGPAGTGYDLTNVGNQLTLTGSMTAGNQIVIRVIGLDANGNNGAVANFDPSQGDVFTLVHTANGITGYTPGEFAVSTANFPNNTQGGSFSVVQNGNDLDLVFNVVPEPSTWVLLGFGVGGAGTVMLRRRVARM